MFFYTSFAFFALVLAGVVLYARGLDKLARVERELQQVRDRLKRLEGDSPPASAVAAALSSAPLPIPRPSPAPPTPAPSISPPAPAFVPSPAASALKRTTEELVGGVWLQNVGSVLLLVGLFFLILWGYTTGRLGPGVLVAAGVATGGLFAWRGDRLVPTVPGFGHALIGIGLGAAYVSLYMGYFTLHVLTTTAAFTLLALVSLAALVAGLHYRVQTISALGVLGAFVPQIAAITASLTAFRHQPAGLLAYFLVVHLSVFILATRRGWSGLVLTSLLLSVVTWILAVGNLTWGWPVTLGLAALFVGLGLAPLPLLVRSAEPARAVDGAVVALAPYAFVACAWPFLSAESRGSIAVLLFALAGIYCAAALWIDRRRANRDLWTALVTSAVVFLTGALERALGSTFTQMGWCVEGVVLVALGIAVRSRWLRMLGTIITSLGAFGALHHLVETSATDISRLGDSLPLSVLTANSIRSLVIVAALFAGARILDRHRDRLSGVERVAVPEFWSAVAHFFVMVWSARHVANLADALFGPISQPAAPGVVHGTQTLAFTLAGMSLAWMLQSAWLVLTGIAGRRVFSRAAAYVIALLAGAMFLAALVAGSQRTAWSSPDVPLFYPAGICLIAFLSLSLGMAETLHQTRARARPWESNVPETATLLVNLLILPWSGLESGHLALTFAPAEAARMTAVLTSAAWVLQASVLFTIGWRRGSPFLRWLGLGLFGITVVKVALVDLAQVDVFWRFLVAIGVGVVLLVVSFVYQRARTVKERS